MVESMGEEADEVRRMHGRAPAHQRQTGRPKWTEVSNAHTHTPTRALSHTHIQKHTHENTLTNTNIATRPPTLISTPPTSSLPLSLHLSGK